MFIDMYSLVENVLGSVLLIWGVALVVNKHIIPAFVKTFMDIEKNETLAYLTASMFLILGLITVWVHNDWYWSLTVIVTLLGWLITIKSSLWLFFPRFLTKLAKKFSPLVLHTWFRIPYGLLVAILGLLILSKYYMDWIL